MTLEYQAKVIFMIQYLLPLLQEIKLILKTILISQKKIKKEKDLKLKEILCYIP